MHRRSAAIERNGDRSKRAVAVQFRLASGFGLKKITAAPYCAHAAAVARMVQIGKLGKRLSVNA